MRKLTRLPLPKRPVIYLARKQTEVDAGRHVVPLWAQARKTQAMKVVCETLKVMAGSLSRCVFCSDSRGTDVEHFWPKRRYPDKAFVWPNLLLSCAGCNSKKGERFDLDQAGHPLLIDPTAEDPWDFLYFDSATGNLAARYDPGGIPHPKGRHTTDPAVLPLNIEAVTEGRQRSRRNLIRAVDRFLESSGVEDDASELRHELIEAVRNTGAYGLAEWYFLHDGQEDQPFALLKEIHPPVWCAVQEALT